MANRYGRNLAVAGVLLGAFVIVGIAFRLLVYPELQDDLVAATSASSQYDHTVTVRLDSFSGYAPLRGDTVRDALRDRSIKLELVDDGADYADRLEALASGDAQMAVFTVDAYLLAGVQAGGWPGSIVAVLDETQGADAIVAYREAVPDLQALDDPTARLTLTPSSPSEFLARVAIAEFGLDDLSTDWDAADGAGAALGSMAGASRSEKRAWVLWEPHVSQALADPAVHVLFESGALSGYIVDVLVAERRFLRDHPDVARAVVEAWLTGVYEAASEDGGLARMVADDARRLGDPLTPDLAERVVDGIVWRTTLDNYAAFGLVDDGRSDAIHLEDAITNIADVLRRTGAVPGDPVGDRATDLFWPGLLEQMRDRDFHPSKGLGITSGGLGTADLSSGGGASLEALSDAEWDGLVPVGSLAVEPISFGRGRATLHVQGRRELDSLARRLKALPRYYVTVVGQARDQGDPEANRILAGDRAEAVRAHLVAAGVPRARIRARVALPSHDGGAAQSVRFELGQRSY